MERQMEELNEAVVELGGSLGALSQRLDRLAAVSRRLEARAAGEPDEADGIRVE